MGEVKAATDDQMAAIRKGDPGPNGTDHRLDKLSLIARIEAEVQKRERWEEIGHELWDLVADNDLSEEEWDVAHFQVYLRLARQIDKTCPERPLRGDNADAIAREALEANDG